MALSSADPDRDTTTLQVCRTCAGIFGLVHDRTRPMTVREQVCACVRRAAGDGARWPGYDFNVAVELGYGCAGAVIPSGFRFASFFCDACRPWVLAVNRAHGWAVIPLGRHTLINGVVLLVGERHDARTVAHFTHGPLTLADGIERLSACRMRRVSAVFATLPSLWKAAAPLPLFLMTAARYPLDDGTIVELCAAFGGAPQA